MKYDIVEEVSLSKACHDKNKVGVVNLVSGQIITFNGEGGVVKQIVIHDTSETASAEPVVAGIAPAIADSSQVASAISPGTDSVVTTPSENIFFEVAGIDSKNQNQTIPGTDIRSIIVLLPVPTSYGPYILLGVVAILFAVWPDFRVWLGDVVTRALKGEE